MNGAFFWKVTLIIFTAISLYAVAAGDWASIVGGMTTLGPWGWQVSFDLILAFIVCHFWIWQDAKKRGVNPIPYIIFTLLTGSVAILFYMAKHVGKPTSPKQTVPAE